MHPNGYQYGEPMTLDTTQDFSATIGTALEDTSNIASKEVVIEALRTVFDPEIPVNIYDLGLIYTIEIKDDGNVFIEMSLTAPGCPVAGEMPGMVSEAAAGVDGIGIVETKLVWEPSWSPDLMSEDAKLALGMY
jgi:FeS assembly SUF system protein